MIGISRSESSLANANYLHVCVDLARDSDIRSLFSRLRSLYGHLDVLINNAAINPTLAPALLVPMQNVVGAFDVNFFGSVRMIREAVKLMLPRKFGRVINISSMAVRHEVPGEAIYTATKAALTAYSRVVAKELYPSGITCNVLAPAAIETEMSAAVNPAELRTVLSRNAVPDMGQMSDVSNAIDWLISPKSQAITGQVIYLGGV